MKLYPIDKAKSGKDGNFNTELTTDEIASSKSSIRQASCQQRVYIVYFLIDWSTAT